MSSPEHFSRLPMTVSAMSARLAQQKQLQQDENVLTEAETWLTNMKAPQRKPALVSQLQGNIYRIDSVVLLHAVISSCSLNKLDPTVTCVSPEELRNMTNSWQPLNHLPAWGLADASSGGKWYHRAEQAAATWCFLTFGQKCWYVSYSNSLFYKMTLIFYTFTVFDLVSASMTLIKSMTRISPFILHSSDGSLWKMGSDENAALRMCKTAPGLI